MVAENSGIKFRRPAGELMARSFPGALSGVQKRLATPRIHSNFWAVGCAPRCYSARHAGDLPAGPRELRPPRGPPPSVDVMEMPMIRLTARIILSAVAFMLLGSLP